MGEPIYSSLFEEDSSWEDIVGGDIPFPTTIALPRNITQTTTTAITQKIGANKEYVDLRDRLFYEANKSAIDKFKEVFFRYRVNSEGFNETIRELDYLVKDPIDFEGKQVLNMARDANTRWVVRSNSTTPIQDAYDSIGDSSATNPYAVMIPPGEWLGETLSLNHPYIHLIGSGIYSTIINTDSPASQLVNITTGANSGIILVQDMTLEVQVDYKPFFNNAGSGITILFKNCRFYNSSSSTTRNYVYKGPDSGANKVFFVDCIFESASSAGTGGILYVLPENTYNNDSCSDTIYVDSCYFKESLFGLMQGTMTAYILNCNRDSTRTSSASRTIDVRSGCTVYLDGGRWGNPDKASHAIGIFGGTGWVANAQFFADENSTSIAAVGTGSTGGTLHMSNVLLNGGDSAITCASGTANLYSGTYRKHASGANNDLTQSSTGTINTTPMVDFTSKGGTITPIAWGEFPITPSAAPDADYEVANKKFVDDSVAPLVTGPATSTDHAVARFHLTTGKIIQNSVPTISDAGILNMVSQRITTVGAPTTNGDVIRRTAKITETILEDQTDYNTDFADRTGFADSGLTTTTLSFVGSTTRTLTISSVGATFDYFIKGVKYTVTTSDAIQLTADTEGKWYIWYAGSTLTTSQTIPTNFWTGGVAPVAIIYWDATNKKALHIHRETHDISRQTHEELHYTVGSTYRTGLDISGYTLNTDSDAAVTFGIADGIIYDEDLDISIVADATPDADFEQKLADPAQIPVNYLSGAGADIRADAATDYAFKNTASGRINYNQLTGGAWQQTQCTDNYFVPYLVSGANLIGVNSGSVQSEPVFSIQGQAQYSKLVDAIEAGLGAFDLTKYAIEELKTLWLLIYRSKDSFGGTRKAKLVSVQDLRKVTVSPGGVLTSAIHNALSDRDAVACHPAGAIAPDVTNFDGALSATEDDVQKALDVLDDAVVTKVGTALYKVITADVFEEDGADFTNWVDASQGTRTCEINPVGQWHYLIPSTGGIDSCRKDRDIGSVPGEFTWETLIKFDDLDTNPTIFVDGTYMQILVCTNVIDLNIIFSEDGVYIYDGAAWQQAQADDSSYNDGAWHTLRFVCDCDASPGLISIYVDGNRVVNAFSTTYDSGVANGTHRITLIAFGAHTGEMHMDWFRIYDGLDTTFDVESNVISHEDAEEYGKAGHVKLGDADGVSSILGQVTKISEETHTDKYPLIYDLGNRRWKPGQLDLTAGVTGLLPLTNVEGHQSRVTVTKNDAQAIDTGTWTKIELDDEVYDDENEFASYRFTADEDGDYAIKAMGSIVSLIDTKILAVAIRKNGTSIARTGLSASGTHEMRHGVAIDIDLVANDYIELWIWHNKGAALNTVAAADSNYLSVHRF